MNLGHWNNVSETPLTNAQDWFGFIYIIENKTNGKRYLGKKQFWSIKRVKVTGRKNRKIVKTKMSWEKYTGSNKDLNDDISSIGKDHFDFRIVQICRTKGGLTYAEANWQHHLEVLTETNDKGDRTWYNGQIGAVRYLPKENTDKKHQEKFRTRN